MTVVTQDHIIQPFNGPIEIGLRALVVLNETYPDAASLQRLIVYDYLVVHSDDIPGGPIGLHPQTPHRGEELLVRRSVLQEGLLLYQSRSLVEQRFERSGLFFAATDRTSSFLDVLDTAYALELRERSQWLIAEFGDMSDGTLNKMVRDRVGHWGAEFALESVLWAEDP
jgi:hypothetical protein